jgi:uncharacterized DUF497 family protein
MANYKKHGVDFADAATVLDDEMALTITYNISAEGYSEGTESI